MMKETLILMLFLFFYKNYDLISGKHTGTQKNEKQK